MRGPPVADGRGREHAQAAGEHRRLVGQDVAEQVLGDQDVEHCRAADEEHRARVHELMVDVDVGELRADLVDDLAPKPRGGQHVRLVHAGQAAAAALRQLHGEPDDAPDLPLRVPEGVDRDAALRGVALLRRAPEVQPGGELADDQEVHALEDLRPDGRRRHERRHDRDRAKVGEELEAATKREQRLLRADPGVRIVPARPADGAEERRVALPHRVQVLAAEGGPVSVHRRAAGDDVQPLDLEAVAGRERLDDQACRPDDLGAHAVAAYRRDPVRGHPG